MKPRLLIIIGLVIAIVFVIMYIVFAIETVQKPKPLLFGQV